MSKETLIELNEVTLNSLLPDNIRQKSRRFFTPIDVAVQSAKWLSGDDCRTVLDIGAGIGKFCLCGAYHTKSEFVGIEMRPHLIKVAEGLFKSFGVENAKMLQGSVTDFKFADFNAFYFYNSFQENLLSFLRMDDTIELSEALYRSYAEYTKSELSKVAKGARLVTFHGNYNEIPDSFKVKEEFRGGDLKYWIKEE